MKTKTDSTLIALYQGGNESALGTLISRHQKELFSFIFYKINDEDLANDVFQDTFVKIIVKLKEGGYTEEGKFIIWAKRIAHNLVMDHFRLKTRHHKISETTYADSEFSILDLLCSTELNVEEMLVSAQINSDLLKILVQLPENQREVVKLRFFDGLSFKEIAEHTDTSINTTLGRVRYALINLRKIIEENKIVLTR